MRNSFGAAERAVEWGLAVSVRTAVVAMGVGIAIVAILGVKYALAKEGGPLEGTGLRIAFLGLDNEHGLAALFSGLLSLIAAAVAWVAGTQRVALARRVVLYAMASFFAFMAIDEVAQLHERLEAATGVAWLHLYTPVIAFGAAVWIITLSILWRYRAAFAVFAGGGACWALAILLEAYVYAADAFDERWPVLPEEVLEMTGSAMFGLGLLIAVQRHAQSAGGRTA